MRAIRKIGFGTWLLVALLALPIVLAVKERHFLWSLYLGLNNRAGDITDNPFDIRRGDSWEDANKKVLAFDFQVLEEDDGNNIVVNKGPDVTIISRDEGEKIYCSYPDDFRYGNICMIMDANMNVKHLRWSFKLLVI